MVSHWLTSIKGESPEKTPERVRNLIGKHKIFAIRGKIDGKSPLNQGDGICFYGAKIGIVAHARLGNNPVAMVNSELFGTHLSLLAFKLEDVHLMLDNPVLITPELRARLDIYKGRPSGSAWGWPFQSTRKLSDHDFRILTGG